MRKTAWKFLSNWNAHTIFSTLLIIPALMISTGCQRAENRGPAASAPTGRPAAPAEEPATAPPEPQKCSDCVAVTVKNFARAESDLYFNNFVKDGGFGKYLHNRTAVPIDKQNVVRMNRDTLYSAAVFDLDASPATITLPDSGQRFLSMQVINEDEYTAMVVYGKGDYTLTKDNIGTRYVATLVRILVDPNNAQDLDEVHKLQDTIKITQKNPGVFEIPKWDKDSQDKARGALLTLASTIHDFSGGFGTKQAVDPLMFLIGAAAGWGGNPDKEAKYLNMKVPNNDGKQVYKITVNEVPVDGFWSISVYNAKGYFEQNPYNAYSINNITAQKSTDGSVSVQFGGCDGKVPNCLPITSGWNATIRLYRPHPEVLTGAWKFPEVQPL